MKTNTTLITVLMDGTHLSTTLWAGPMEAEGKITAAIRDRLGWYPHDIRHFVALHKDQVEVITDVDSQA